MGAICQLVYLDNARPTLHATVVQAILNVAIEAFWCTEGIGQVANYINCIEGTLNSAHFNTFIYLPLL